MPTLDGHLQSIIDTADSIRNSLSPHVLAMHGFQMTVAAQVADAAVEEIKLILESPDPRKCAGECHLTAK